VERFFTRSSSWLIAFAMTTAAWASASPLPAELTAVEDYERYRTLLGTPVERRVAYFEPGARDWALLVTEHRGETVVRDVLAARDRYADRWRYLEVGPAAGLQVAGRRAMAWNVAHSRPGEPPRRSVHAVVAMSGRTLVLEYRGLDGGARGFDDLRKQLERYRPPSSTVRRLAPWSALAVAVVACVLAVRLRRRSLVT
jgi:hypothetical protein